jgi:ATP-binding cassette, subfamily B, bacterial CvaB/MchF/RaxB
VGGHGSALSGEQLQRIFLARALYKRPSVLLLDKGTSHLDLNTDARVNANLRITRIIVALRPSTIETADRVIRLGENHS